MLQGLGEYVMPRKKAVETIEKNEVATAMSEITMLINDRIAEAVAQLSRRGMIEESSAQSVTSTIQAVSKDCINTIRATRGM